MRQALLIAGPTSSGKSALALALAERLGGTVINADAMQCYRELRVLTARPTPEEEARAPHALYGVLPAAQAGSVAWWREQALRAMEGARLPILCGGTGMYLRALTQGISALPDVTPEARAEARALPHVVDGARWLVELLPEEYRPRIAAPPERRLPTQDDLLRPPAAGAIGACAAKLGEAEADRVTGDDVVKKILEATPKEPSGKMASAMGGSR